MFSPSSCMGLRLMAMLSCLVLQLSGLTRTLAALVKARTCSFLAGLGLLCVRYSAACKDDL